LHPRRPPAAEETSWNSRFQDILARINFESQANLEECIQLNNTLLQLVQDYIQFVRRYAKLIISERFLAEKSVQPTCSEGQHLYIIQDICFRFGTIVGNLTKSDEISHKLCGNELLAVGAFAGCTRSISTPIMVLVDYMGFRVMATPVLPISSSTHIAGSADGGKTVMNGDPEFSQICLDVARRLNLKPHLVGVESTQTQELALCGDAQGHHGHDNRYYLTHLGRLFPPDTTGISQTGAHLYRLLRPEFVLDYPTPLCSDAFSMFIRLDPANSIHNAEVMKASQALQQKTIPDFARKLNWAIREAIDAGTLASVTITEDLHQHGINIRYLGMLETWISDHDSRRLIYIEGVARVLKNRLRLLLRTRMRQLKLPLEVPYRQAVIDYYNLVFVRSESTDPYWSDAIDAKLRSYFMFSSQWASSEGRNLRDICFGEFPSKDPSRPNLCGRALIFHRLEQMMGLKFSSFARKKVSNLSRHPPPFDLLDLEEIGDRIKHTSIFNLTEAMYFFYRGQIKFDRLQAKYYLSRANDYFADALRSDPRNPTILNLSCQSQYQLLELSTAINLNVSLSQVVFQTSREGIIDPDVAKTDVLFLRAIDANPTNSHLLYLYAKFLGKCGRQARAEDFFLRSLELRPAVSEVLAAYGSFLEENHDEDASLLQRFAMEFRDTGVKPKPSDEITDPVF
jgi:hypothetical protein